MKKKREKCLGVYSKEETKVLLWFRSTEGNRRREKKEAIQSSNFVTWLPSYVGTRLFSENISNFITDSGKRIIEFIRILSVSSQVQYTEHAACIPQSYF